MKNAHIFEGHLARRQPSFIKDTTDLLNRIQNLNEQGPFPKGTLLVSWDVVSMFPNIDNELGLGAVSRALDTREQLLPSTDCILEAVEICLKSNHLVFNEKFYLQIHGTAMGPTNVNVNVYVIGHSPSGLFRTNVN